MPEGIGYDIPALRDALSGLFAQPQGPAVPPPQDLMVPDELNPIEGGPLQGLGDIARTAAGLGQGMAQQLQPQPEPGVVPEPEPESTSEPTLEERQAVLEIPHARAPGEAGIADLQARRRELGKQAAGLELTADQKDAQAKVEHAEQLDANARQVETKRQELAAARKDYTAKKRAERAGLVEAVKEFRPDAWKQYGTGGRVLATLGVALGGWLSAGRGTNQAAQIVEKQLQRNLREQMAQYDADKGLLKEHDSMFADMMEVYKDKDAALLGTLASMKEQAAAEMEQKIAVTSGNERAKANALRDVMALQESAAADRIAADARSDERLDKEFDQKMEEKRLGLAWSQHNETKRANREDEEVARIRLVRDFLKDQVEYAASAADKVKNEGGTPVLYGIESVEEDGLTGKASVAHLTPKQRDDVATLTSSAQLALDMSADIDKLGTDSNYLRDEGKALAGAVLARARLAKQALVDGIPSDADQALLDAGFGDIKNPQEVLTLLNSEERRNVLKSVVDMDLRDIDSKLVPYGVKRLPTEGRSVLGKPTKTNPRHPVQFDLSKARKEGNLGEELMNLAKSGAKFTDAQTGLPDVKAAEKAYTLVFREHERITKQLAKAKGEELKALRKLEVQASNALREAAKQLKKTKDRKGAFEGLKNNPYVPDLYK